MRLRLPRISRSDALTILVFAVALVGLAAIRTDFAADPEPGRKERAEVLTVDNSDLREFGPLTAGSQMLTVRLLSGPLRGTEFKASNQLRADMELDKIFAPGDRVLVAVMNGADPANTILFAQDHYRLHYTWMLFALFALLLVIFGGVVGVKALLSFGFCCLVVWRFVVPLCLKGHDPVWIAVAAVSILTAAVIFLAAGFNRKGVTAFAGAMLGVLCSAWMADAFTSLFHINGGVMPYARVLLFSGYETLDLPRLFVGAVILAASGAVMDLGMDVAAGMQEVVEHHPAVSRRELTRSGLRIGRSVVGTMSTTLLLAYSGGYLTLMMAFVAQGVHPVDFINNPYVASEAVKTIIGSFGLVLVAPFTALAGGFLLKKGGKNGNGDSGSGA